MGLPWSAIGLRRAHPRYCYPRVLYVLSQKFGELEQPELDDGLAKDPFAAPIVVLPTPEPTATPAPKATPGGPTPTPKRSYNPYWQLLGGSNLVLVVLKVPPQMYSVSTSGL